MATPPPVLEINNSRGKMWTDEEELALIDKTDVDFQLREQSSTSAMTQSTRKRLVIFDKDGTLVCLNDMWAPWIRALAYRMETATGMELAEKVYAKVSFDDNTGQLHSGLISEGTWQQVQDTLADLVVEGGLPRRNADHIMRECWQAPYGNTQSIGDVGHLFRVLKSKGYLIAVNTSDHRKTTETTLEHLGLKCLVDMVVCGDDEDVLAKPHPSTARKICTKLQVEPRDAVMVGDSTTDMKLKCNAGLGCAIGVLTGFTRQAVLENLADYVVADIHQALAIILEQDSSTCGPRDACGP